MWIAIRGQQRQSASRRAIKHKRAHSQCAAEIGSETGCSCHGGGAQDLHLASGQKRQIVAAIAKIGQNSDWIAAPLSGKARCRIQSILAAVENGQLRA